ncbi:hypothetical protein HK097_009190 [Rhizophlyctis rosea]|uniref:Uncharacterized protein n=1 Tax=Rhizophlyctis rosea TaxID=64517 RepID=A0AAD5S9A4_9FUNG|nr:hypothetical protein HK097_009190 [Rhizophlyctis rosea]
MTTLYNPFTYYSAGFSSSPPVSHTHDEEMQNVSNLLLTGDFDQVKDIVFALLTSNDDMKTEIDELRRQKVDSAEFVQDLYSMLLEHVMKADSVTDHHHADTDLSLVDESVRLGDADWKLLGRVRTERNNHHHANQAEEEFGETDFRKMVDIAGRFARFLLRKLRQ